MGNLRKAAIMLAAGKSAGGRRLGMVKSAKKARAARINGEKHK